MLEVGTRLYRVVDVETVEFVKVSVAESYSVVFVAVEGTEETKKLVWNTQLCYWTEEVVAKGRKKAKPIIYKFYEE